MRKYEVIVIFSGMMSESQLKQETGKIETLLANQGVRGVTVENWGKKELACLLHGQKSGNYRSFKFETDKHEVIAILSGQLRITDGVLKFQTHRLNDRVRKFKGTVRRTPQGDEGELEDEAVEGIEA